MSDILVFRSCQTGEIIAEEFADDLAFYISERHSSKSDRFWKVFAMHDDDSPLDEQLEIQAFAEQYNITPKLHLHYTEKWESGILRNNIFINDGYEFLLITFVFDSFGISIADKYHIYNPPVTSEQLLNLDLFDRYFPPVINNYGIPEHIRIQIKDILQILHLHGWCHQDVHAGNFLIKDDIVKIIDFGSVRKLI
jgi:serine/threonine protein kinase